MEENVDFRPGRSPAAGRQSDLKLGRYAPATIMVVAALFFAYDIVGDLLSDTEHFLHVLIECAVFLAILILTLTELLRVRQLSTEVLYEKEKTARLSGELIAVLHDQFATWKLSPSESEVAMLLIKGLSMKEISEARSVREKTVRQQAASIYAKTGLAGRHELVAYFIEDLLSGEPV
jgi:DNA-binding CsgD family transcriptional regulator